MAFIMLQATSLVILSLTLCAVCEREASYLSQFAGWHYYKVPVTGEMTSTNVKDTCEAAGYVTPCPGDSDCPHSSSSCVDTGLDNCSGPMDDVARVLCGNSSRPDTCDQLDGVYQFMINWRSDDGACGVESGSWCTSGSGRQDRYAFCARDRNVTIAAHIDVTTTVTPRKEPKRESSFLALYKGWRYYKVPVTGEMTSSNVKATCEAAGYVAPCPGDSECRYSSSSCVATGLKDCGLPMNDVSQVLCGTTPDDCAQFDGVYQFTDNWESEDDACGVESGGWCKVGTGTEDRYAFCATDRNVTTIGTAPHNATTRAPDTTGAHGKAESKLAVSFLALYNGWHYYKVPVTGAMTSANVKATCEAAGYVTPCPGDSECRYSSSSCVVTGLEDCIRPMNDISKVLCESESTPHTCAQLDGVYQFMNNWKSDDDACGAESGRWCIEGSERQDRYAFCAEDRNVTTIGVATHDTTTAAPASTIAHESKRKVSYLALYKGWHYYKVPVTGEMTSSNVKATCEAAGYVAPCPGDSECRYSSSSCVATGLKDCGLPMNDVSQVLCGNKPNDCAQFDGVYQFMDNWESEDDACGVESGSWCEVGAGKEDRYAFCAKDVATDVATTPPHDTTVGHDEAPSNCCGNILRQATEVVDQFSNYQVPDGWTMCYIDGRDTAYYRIPCRDLIQGIPGYENADQLLAGGGNFGCWHGNTGDTPGPAFAKNNVIKNSCRDGVQQNTLLSSWSKVQTTTLGVCIKGITCDQRMKAPEPSKDISASVKCTNDYMELSIPVDELTDITLNDLHWEPDQNCGATTNGTHYLFRTGLHECGTQVTFDPKYVIFRNNINIIGTPTTNSVIARDGDIRITSKCKYERQQWVDSTFLPIPGGHGLNITEEGFGQLEVRLSMFPTSQYQSQYRANQFPIHIKLRQRVYMQLEAQGHGKKVSVLALNCKATMSPEPNDTLQYQLINDGCASDPTLDIFSIDDPGKERFGFEAFRFIQEVKTVYVHCEVMVCNAADPGSRCAKGCVSRRKRTAGEKIDMIGRHVIRMGPIIVDDSEAAESNPRDRRSAAWSLLAAGGGLMALALVVLGAAIVLKRSRREEWAYQGLTHVDEEGEE
ncbi:uncharacterized protein LOC118422164 [Branchiostoma floridae]|uniref:Uncharacterized protein LOC118422164 n=1 Tax=Branchiostoma floridae TaxID=7739 RepID=A0A9J7LMC6_BRAFL|nr:uncharacterized protein LOC118422164 [Branchiostoma floridae]